HRRDFVAESLHLPLDAADQPVDPACIDIALSRRMPDGAGELVAVEWLALGVLLDHCEVAQLHPLEGREARPARLALTAAADRRPILAGPAVLNLTVFVRAEWAAHYSLVPIGERREPRSG